MVQEEEEQIVARKKRGGSLGEGMQGSSREQVDGPQRHLDFEGQLKASNRCWASAPTCPHNLSFKNFQKLNIF